MRTLLFLLYHLSSALTDPCVNHKVLDQPWRSIDCYWTNCIGDWKCDKHLQEGWYRFNGSGGSRIPEMVVPDEHCTASYPGWLNGVHPTVDQGEVQRTICFNSYNRCCELTREIKIKNCSSYFVYMLKPTHDRKSTYCTVPELPNTDPCEDHTVLEEPWRSIKCQGSECSDQKCDTNLNHGWYRFKSSGGWKIAETAIPEGHCSAGGQGWLNGAHPTVGEGEVKRTVCLNWKKENCHRALQIKIRNCATYFVYELQKLHTCYVYCTDPGTVPTREPASSSPTGTETSGTATPPTHGEQSSGESSEQSSSASPPSPTSDPLTSPTRTHSEPSSGESTERLSSVPAASPTSDIGTAPTQKQDEPSNSESIEPASSSPTGTETSGTSIPRAHGEQSTGECSEQSSSVPAPSPTSGISEIRHKSTGKHPTQSSTVPVDSPIPGFLFLSEEDCEAMDVEVQVMYVGNNKLESPKEKEAYLRQVQDMIKHYLPCKKLVPTDYHREEKSQFDQKRHK